MCFCESDAVNCLIHVRSRKRYPGIKYHEPTLSRIAREFGIDNTLKLRVLPDPEIDKLSRALLRALPPEACPRKYKKAVAMA